MKSRLLVIVTAVVVLLSVGISAAADKASNHWYQVTISLPTTEGKYTFVGMSLLTEDELVKSLAKADEFIKLDDCLYYDKKGGYKSWSEWDPIAEPRLYINPKHIVVLQPLAGDPRRLAADGKAKK